MNELKLALYWEDIPVGRENAVDYDELIKLWNVTPRTVRAILHELSGYDNGDDYILVRSGTAKGFYRTDDHEIIKAYRKECLNKGRSVFLPVRKCNRVLNANVEQFDLVNNMRNIRTSKGLKQADLCEYMQSYDRAVDTALISKFENGTCLPTPYQLQKIADFYAVEPGELITDDLYYT